MYFVRKDITVADRITIASLALSKEEETTISQLARDYATSRKFIREHIGRAEAALVKEFCGVRIKNPVVEITDRRIIRAVRSAALDGHSSVRGIVEQLAAVWQVEISEGKVIWILQDTAGKAARFNQAQKLDRIGMGAHDEIFSQRQAVLAGVEVESTYLYLLERVGGRSSTHWGVVLLDKQAEQGLQLERIIGDAAKGLRSGAQAAYPGATVYGDIFHATDKLNDVRRHLEGRAYERLAQAEEKAKQLARREACGKDRRGYHRGFVWARQQAESALAALDRFEILRQWLRELWQVSGYEYATRAELYEWLVGEISQIPGSPVKRLVTYLKNEKEALLEFVRCLDGELERFRQQEQMSRETLAWLRQQALYGEKDRAYWRLEGKLRSRCGARVPRLQEKLEEILRHVVRASSIVEGINSLLRPYFFLRKRVGEDFLPRLQFYLNTRKYRRSEWPERAGKSPLELLTGQEQPHWLDILDALDEAESTTGVEEGLAA